MPSTPNIPLLIPDVPGFDALEPWLRRIDANRHYTNFGPLNALFEQSIAARHAQGEESHAVAFASGTAALVAWLSTVTAGRKGRVLIPAITFTATAQAVIASGNTPFIADIDPSDWLLSPQFARELAATEAFVAMLPVAAYGAPCDTAPWDALARDTGIPVLIDAAGAFGNQMLGATTDIAFSFHATKALAAGEGGAVLTRNIERVAPLIRASNFGIDTRNGLTIATGVNGKLSEYHAAVGLASLDNWPETARRRRRLAQCYAAEIAARCPAVSLPPRPVDGVYTLMPVLLPDGYLATDCATQLAAAGVQSRRWYCPPLHQHPRFADFPNNGALPHAETLGQRLLGLPFHLDLQDADIARICVALGQFIEAGSFCRAAENIR